ncbi:hypothetical protein AMAG_14782 [Allomyces macrogynus ATCC 38327]|uniref:t-SNARE coiled-coil homology domain-containing protein n=1 Tax=Allomyces macrogynus (strain ATCC 38327) TaxID=578462 RepID=A0A0L0T5B7_ALLM3|nr:hypothetical protein AMAG_14782 [Allomyces macrogynus ATCC 38327]|eukprot:KNE69937.1 hypothetical protein AMAG_14782 [Allomyces macrogynus ATCC 38327]
MSQYQRPPQQDSRGAYEPANARASPAQSPPVGRDRMAELRAAGIQRPMTVYSNDPNAGVAAGSPSGAVVAEFLDDVAAMDRALRRVKEDLARLDQSQRRVFDAMPERQAAENQREIDAITAQTKSVLSRMRDDLNHLDAQLATLTRGTADYAMCGNQLVTVKKRYQEQVQAFHALETAFQGRQRDRLLREMRIVKPDATANDVDEYLASGGQGGIFAQEVLHSARYGDARNALRAVQDRHAELRAIEATVEELAQLFLDLNTLIEQQDYTINQVTEYVEATTNDLERGEKEVDKAVEIRKNSIKWSWYLCGCVVLILAAVAIWLFVFGPGKDWIKGSGNSSGSTTTTVVVVTATPTPTPTASGIAKSLLDAWTPAPTPAPTP